jgi:predicted RNA-binding Zn-ribbon protein involved in translation (DUF1610 family)
VPEQTPTKMRFTYFKCPRCGHQATHAWVLIRFFGSRYWCENCDAYFTAKNDWLIGSVYGLVFSALGFIVAAGPLHPWFSGDAAPFEVALVLGLLILLPLGWAIWGLFISRLLKYEYVGKRAN